MLIISVKNTLGLSAVAFWECEIMQLIYGLLCVVRTVDAFDFELVTNEASNKRRPVGRRPCKVNILRFSAESVFPLTTVASVEGLYPRCEGPLYSHEYSTVPSTQPK